MSIPTIRARLNGGDITVRVTDPTHPQAVAGVIWRYNPDESPDGSAGDFGTDQPEVVLGRGASVDGRFFQAEGAVLAMGDDPPSPYRVVVSVRQDGALLHEETPASGGSGTVGADNQPFVHSFRIVLA